MKARGDAPFYRLSSRQMAKSLGVLDRKEETGHGGGGGSTRKRRGQS